MAKRRKSELCIAPSPESSKRDSADFHRKIPAQTNFPTDTSYANLSPIARYTLDGPLGSIANGATIVNSAHGYNGTMGAAGASYVAGKIGQGVNFTATTGQYVTVPYNAAFNTTTWTASAWVDMAAAPATGQEYGILGTRNGSDTFDMKYSNAAGVMKIHADIGYGSGWDSTGADATTTLSLNSWHQVAYSVTNTSYTIYVDGVAVSGGSGTLGTPAPFMLSGQSLFIGNDYSTPELMNGSLDNVSIFGGASSAAQISQLYLAQLGQLPSTTPALVAPGAMLDLNGLSQTVASLSDVSGSGGGVTSSSSGALTLTLAPAAGSATTFSGAISNGNGTVGLTLSGSGGLQVLAGTNTFTGPTTISAGTLAIGGGGVLGNGNYSAAIANSGALAVNTSSNQTFGGVISGNGALYQLGSGVTTLTASNTYSGATTIGGGTLQVGNGGSGASIGGTSGVSMANNATSGLQPCRQRDLRPCHQRQRRPHADRQRHADPHRKQQLHRPHRD